MSIVPVVWWDGEPGTWWDQGLLELALGDRLWHQQDGFEFQLVSLEVAETIYRGCVLMVPGRFWAGDADVRILNAVLDRMRWCLVIVTTDEETLLDTRHLGIRERHEVWAMTPVPGGAPADRFLGEGYASDTREALALMAGAAERDVDVAFAGQVTHKRRSDAVAAIRAIPDHSHKVVPTPGFAQGLSRDAYLHLLSRAKVAPAPGGPATPDSFRLYEALEAHCVPIADEFPALKGYPPGYWDEVLPGHPFPVIREWKDLQKYVDAALSDWPHSANVCAAWWMDQKRQLVADLHDTVGRLSGLERPQSGALSDAITVVMPTSPIVSHPDTAIVQQVVDSVRFHLPGAEVIIAADGVRPEQERLRPAYDEYLRRLLWLADHQWGNVRVELHEEHQHQANVTRQALESVRTPLILFVEHDTPVWPEPIDWPALVAAVRSGRANLVRFHHEAHVLEVHQHMMLDREPQDIEGAPLLRTVQWSQRPHLASTGFYRTLLAAHFPESGRTMIEDRMHGILHNAYRQHGMAGWEQYRTFMYAPPGDIKRSGHLDGRDTEPKFEMKFS